MDDKSINGLFFGLVAGLIFSLSVWGIDALSLARSSAAYPWLKLVVGGALCLLACGIAGWISATVDRGWFSFLIWLGAGILLAWIASHMPFEGSSIALGLLNPELKSFDAYPFVLSAEVRMKLLYFLVGILSGLGGFIGDYLIESASRASSQFMRWATFALVAPLFIIPGVAADDLINTNLRTPLEGVNDVIRFALENENRPVSKEEARAMHLSTLDPLQDLLHRPRRLILGDYEATLLSQASVVIDFDGIFAQCWTAGISPTFCQRSDDRYLDKLGCLLRDEPGRSCGITVPASAQGDFEAVVSQIGTSPSAQITNQVGTLVDVRIDNNRGAIFDCRLRSMTSITLEYCNPAEQSQASISLASTPVRIFQTKTPVPTRTATATGAAAPSVRTAIPDSQTTQATGPSQPESQPVFKEETFNNPPVYLPYTMAELTDLSSAPIYTITIDVDYARLTFAGHQWVDYTNAEQEQLSSLFFHLFPNGQRSYGNGSLRVSQALVDGKPVATRLSMQDSALEVRLPRSLAPGESLVVELDFEGAVPVDFGSDATPDGYGIYNFSNGVLALAGWYPILSVYDDEGWNIDPNSKIGDSVYADMAYYTVDLTTDSDLVVATTGTPLSRKIAGKVTHYRYRSGPAREFFLIMSPDFDSVSQMVGETRVNSYYLSGNEHAGAQALEVASGALEVYNQRFGAYPYTELDVVQAPMRNAAGVEFPGIVLIASSQYEDPGKPSFIVTIAHEVAHQWWYNLVGNDVIDEPWLDEGLTSYSSALYLEAAEGSSFSQGLINTWQDRYDQLVKDGKDERVTESLAFFESLSDPRVYGAVAYAKGALFYDALRKEIGDQAFFDGLHKYYESYRYRIATTAGLLEVFEEASGRRLDDITRKWLYSP